MLFDGYFFGDTDITEVALIAFFIFFLGLVIYLRREDRREGYPLEDDATGRHEPGSGMFFTARAKSYRLTHGGGSVLKPNSNRDTHQTSGKRTAPWSGSPYVPVGDPLLAGVGPGAWAERSRSPELTLHGDVKIVPLRVATDFSIAKGDPDPRGMPVIGADGKQAGVVSDVWVDRSESLIRYVEVAVDGAGRRVLAPMTMAAVDRGRRRITIPALQAHQFSGAPMLTNPDQISLYEEERVCAYFGAGYLYASPARAEPWL